ADRAADPEWHKRRQSRLPPHNRCRMEIASTAFDGIQSRLDEHRQKELESQDRRGLNRESNRQLRWRTIHSAGNVSVLILPTLEQTKTRATCKGWPEFYALHNP